LAPRRYETRHDTPVLRAAALPAPVLRPRATPRRGAAGPLLTLQRQAGNRAVARLVAPRTGLRTSPALHRFAAKAVSFLRRNGDLPLQYYARYLGAAVNEELAAVGCPAVNVTISPGVMSAAAEFEGQLWTMAVNPDEFTHREGVEKLGDLTDDEAGIIAMTVYHEARHAEQHFRMARLLAAEHALAGDLDIPDEVAAAAKAKPLKGSRAERTEASDWRTNEIGADRTYREAVTWWMGEARKAAHLAQGDPSADTRERIESMVRGWTKGGGSAAQVIHAHAGELGARRSSKIGAQIAKDIARIDAALAEVQGALQSKDAKPLADALVKLYKALYDAYRDQPVEADAWDAGYAVFDAFSAEAKRHAAAAAVP
jgi:hypothetical protein